MYAHVSKSSRRILIHFSFIDWPILGEGLNVYYVLKKLIEGVKKG